MISLGKTSFLIHVNNFDSHYQYCRGTDFLPRLLFSKLQSCSPLSAPLTYSHKKYFFLMFCAHLSYQFTVHKIKLIDRDIWIALNNLRAQDICFNHWLSIHQDKITGKDLNPEESFQMIIISNKALQFNHKTQLNNRVKCLNLLDHH